MADAITNAKNALDALAVAIRDGWSGDQTLNEAWGWNCPVLDRYDLAFMATFVGERISEIAPDQIDEDLEGYLGAIPDRVA